MLDKSIQVGIIGLGMIGGSIAKTLSKKGFKVFASDSNENTIKNAINEKEICGSLEELDQDINFILIFTVPVLSVGEELIKNKELLSKALLVSDGLSVKNSLKKEIEKNKFNTENFIFSHPIAGSEKSGYLNSKEGLFDNKITVITKLPHSKQVAIDTCINLWSLLGAKTINLNLEDHDKYFAQTSHLPHFIAFALISMISKSEDLKKDTFTGGGLKDITRIASSDPKMWEDIFISNRLNILKEIKSFKSEIDKFEKLIEEQDAKEINQFIKNAKNFRDSLT
jgi:prephenate dehydrogenase